MPNLLTMRQRQGHKYWFYGSIVPYIFVALEPACAQ
jgi:hypothetical protein